MLDGGSELGCGRQFFFSFHSFPSLLAFVLATLFFAFFLVISSRVADQAMTWAIGS